MSFSVHATSRYIPMSPRKVRLVLELVRGVPVDQAQAMLGFMTQAAARPVAKLIASAAANAEENYGLMRDELYIAEIAADGGPSYKRGRFGGRGRYKPQIKRSCHVSVALREINPEPLPGTEEDEE
ncbi:MAG: 50S ribosomal protein L22 [Anaerolineae bacterium]|jgi:large subunit ribosomal protein L22